MKNCTKREKADSIHLHDNENRSRAKMMVQKTKQLFSPERGHWVRVDAKTLKFQPYK